MHTERRQAVAQAISKSALTALCNEGFKPLAEDLAKRIPVNMHEGFARYVLLGGIPGSFLTAVFENNLLHAASKADIHNAPLLSDYARILFNRLPTACFGSEDAVAAWHTKGGAIGDE